MYKFPDNCVFCWTKFGLKTFEDFSSSALYISLLCQCMFMYVCRKQTCINFLISVYFCWTEFGLMT